MAVTNKTSIIILTYNKLAMNKDCLESVMRHTNAPHEIIVVDNNSTDGTAEWLQSLDGIKLILNTENMGFPKGCNQGIRIAEPCNDILLLNNDTIVTQNWLINMQTALYSSSEIGACGCLTNSCSSNQCIPISYRSSDEMQLFASKHNISNPEKWEYAIRLVGFCMLIKRRAIDETGLLDERFSPGNFEDDDYSLRLLLAGYRLLLCKDTFIHHHGMASFGEYLQLSELLKTNLFKFKSKHGFSRIFVELCSDAIISAIERPANDKFTLLDVHCAYGQLPLMLAQKYKNADLYGIEPDISLAKIASAYASLHIGNAGDSSFSPAFAYEYFDYIVFSDVLEDFPDPWSVLERYRAFLKVNGELLVLLPNMMNYYVLEKILQGKWDYQNTGPMDHRHLHFFTLHGMLKMLVDCGYSDFVLHPISIDDGMNNSSIVSMLTKISSPKLESQYKAKQYLVSARKKV